MNFDSRCVAMRFLSAMLWLPLAAAAQTLNLSNGVQTYSALTNTIVKA